MRAHLLVLILAAAGAATQEPVPEPALLLPPAAVEVVNVDVFVTDEDGRPASGLAAADFEVFEDGQRMRVVNFSDASSLAPADRASAPEAPPQPAVGPAAVAVPPEGRVHVAVYVDNRRLFPAHRQRMLEWLQALFANRPPGERVLVASRDYDFVVRQPFTEDMAAVRAALAGLEKGSGAGAESAAALRQLVWRIENAAPQEAEGLLFQVRAYAEQEAQRTQETLAQLTRFVDLLGGLPGRKAVFYVCDGLPSRPGEALYRAWVNRFGEPTGGSGATAVHVTLQEMYAHVSQLGATLFADDPQLGSFRNLVVRANANRVTLYAVDASFASPAFGGVSAESAGGGGYGDVRTWDQDTETVYRQDLTGSLSYMADFTGGRKLPGNETLARRVAEVRESLAAAYQLAYEPAHVGDGKFHKIDVKLERPGLKVRHREGYRAKPDDERLADGAYAALLEAGENPLGIALESGPAKPNGKGAFRVPVVVKLAVGRLGLLRQGGQDVGRLTVSFVVQDTKGGLSAPQKREVPLGFPSGTVKPGTTQTIGYPVPLLMKPGEYQVAVSVRDEISGKRSAAVLRVKL